MFEGIKITMVAKEVIGNAERAVRTQMGYKLDSQHLLYGLASVPGSVSTQILASKGISAQRIYSYINTFYRQNMFYTASYGIEFSNDCAEIIKKASLVAKQTSGEIIGSEHLLYALLTNRQCVAVKIIEQGFNVSAEDLKEILLRFFKESEDAESGRAQDEENNFGLWNENKKPQTNSINGNLPKELQDLGRDVTELARQGKIDKIIGREEEIERITEILCRKTKNNPILIGEAGVGKSAVVEGLALSIVSNNVPDELKGKTVFSFEIASLLAGTKYRGAMEEKLKQAINVIINNKNIIVFIDEIHTLIQAASEKGEVGPADVLKPYLARGELQTIGATTIDEYRKFIEKDKAFERRFQPIMVNPPSVQDTIKILNGLKASYENFHKVTISDEAILSAVNLTDRYVTDRNFPDKAIDVIDEASSRAKVLSVNKGEKVIIGEKEVAEVISKWTQIPVTKLSETESEKLLHLEEILHKRVVGQDEAIAAVSRALKRSRIGLQDGKRPIGSFLFLGQTGVGKTELCKALAEAMFDSENALIRVDMSEYMESHSVAKLIGAPPGYVGFDDGGQLTEQVRRKPYSVILFDEIEKAHNDVLNILLQLLDDGRLTDGKGRVVNFKNTIIILTSNIGVSELKKNRSLGFKEESDEREDYEKTKEILLSALKTRMRPELINRLDSVIVFHKLSKLDMAKIAKILITNLNNRLKQQNIEIRLTESALKYIVEKGGDEEYGARPLRRFIQREIEDALADKILMKEISKDSIILVNAKNNRLVFENEN